MTARGILVRVALAFYLCLLARPGSPAQALQGPNPTVAAATRLAKLFTEMLKPFEEIGATGERQHLIDSLIDLNRDLFDLEQDKRYLIVALKRSTLNLHELSSAADSLGKKVKKLQGNLKLLGPQLRVAYRKGADEAIDSLSEALVSRQGVVLSLKDKNAVDSQISDAEAAVKALGNAQRSLADAIDNLQKQQ